MNNDAIVVKDTDVKIDKLRAFPYRDSPINEEKKPRINIGNWKSEKGRLSVFVRQFQFY